MACADISAAMTPAEIAANVEQVRLRIARAATRAGRPASDITLIAVTKTVPAENVDAAFEAGVCDFGENYVREALQKQQAVAGVTHTESGLPRLLWHFIGHLQGNKVREIVGHFDLIHSVDSISLARDIARRSQLSGITTGILLEVKLDPADTKFGFDIEALPPAVQEIGQLQGIHLRGLMGMAPYSADSQQARPHFQRLYTVFNRLPRSMQQTLSMGMTADFEVAIEEGATHVRIGTAIFGKRYLRSTVPGEL